MSSLGHSLRIASTIMVAATLAAPAIADQIRFDRPSEWRQWSLPLGAVRLDGDVIRQRMGAMARGEYKLVYVAPERLTFDGFRDLVSKLDCPLVAIDEAAR